MMQVQDTLPVYSVGIHVYLSFGPMVIINSDIIFFLASTVAPSF
jgi:hypothetical protein